VNICEYLMGKCKFKTEKITIVYFLHF
jgi:hypothetical protein